MKGKKLNAAQLQRVLVVARAHGTKPAAEWAGLSPDTVSRLRKQFDGYTRGRGHPSVAEMAMVAPREDCPCPRCVALFPPVELRFDLGDRILASVIMEMQDQLAAEQPWRAEAVCLATYPDSFFPSFTEGVSQAQRVCAGCPVRDECRDYALANGIDHGVWGGQSERARRRLLGAAA